MPQAKTSIRLVCFDLGGVLVRIARGWDDACRRAGVALPHAAEDAWARHHELMLRYETGELDEAGYLGEAPGVIGGGVGTDAIVRVFDAWLLGMYPGATELIDELTPPASRPRASPTPTPGTGTRSGGSTNTRR